MRGVRILLPLALSGACLVAGLTAFTRSVGHHHPAGPAPFDAVIEENGRSLFDQGRETFRYDTFGDEAFWGGQMMLHQAIEGEKFGGVGPGVSPRAALAAGLKVDVDALPLDV